MDINCYWLLLLGLLCYGYWAMGYGIGSGCIIARIKANILPKLFFWKWKPTSTNRNSSMISCCWGTRRIKLPSKATSAGPISALSKIGSISPERPPSLAARTSQMPTQLCRFQLAAKSKAKPPRPVWTNKTVPPNPSRNGLGGYTLCRGSRIVKICELWAPPKPPSTSKVWSSRHWR